MFSSSLFKSLEVLTCDQAVITFQDGLRNAPCQTQGTIIHLKLFLLPVDKWYTDLEMSKVSEADFTLVAEM